ncbi:MAG: hypothetical protein LBD24_07895 [Spirochaetaceae bacterium]|nr:hypothetical protein [Spirochaetaceae bacterium]
MRPSVTKIRPAKTRACTREARRRVPKVRAATDRLPPAAGGPGTPRPPAASGCFKWLPAPRPEQRYAPYYAQQRTASKPSEAARA